MKITNFQNIQNVTDLPSMVRYTSIDLSLILAVINGNVDLVDNGSTDLLTVTFPKANTSYPFTHNLGRLPQGFLNAGMNFSAAVFNGVQANTIAQIYLQAGSTGTGKVLVF